MIKFKSPEHKLWWMIIKQLLVDLEMSIIKAEQEIKTRYSLYQQCNLRDILWEIHHEYMREICDNAGINYMCFLDVVEKIVHKKISIAELSKDKSKYF